MSELEMEENNDLNFNYELLRKELYDLRERLENHLKDGQDHNQGFYQI